MCIIHKSLKTDNKCCVWRKAWKDTLRHDLWMVSTDDFVFYLCLFLDFLEGSAIAFEFEHFIFKYENHTWIFFPQGEKLIL